MSLPGWALPAVATVIVGFGLFGVYSYVDTGAQSAQEPIVPILLSDDEEPSSVQQSNDVPTSTAVPKLAPSSSSGPIQTPTDPWTSEVMEAVSRGPLVQELKKVDEADKGDDLFRGASSDHSSRLEDSVSTEAESPAFETPSSENTTAYSQNSAQPSTEQHAGESPQQATTLVSPPGAPTATEAYSPPPTDSQFPWGVDADEGGGSDERKRIFITEDPRALGESLAMVLNREPDLEVVGRTGSAAECRNFVRGEEAFDVSIVDLFLPDAQGTYLIEELRRSCPHAPVLVLTTSLDPRDHERAIKAGADAALSKSADPEEIISAVRRLAQLT